MKHSKSGLFLMELIIALLFFALASTVCIRLFVKSATLSDDTLDLTYAVRQAQNLAECYVSCDGDIVQIHFLFPESTILEDNLLVIEENGLISTLTFYPEDEAGLISGDIVISDSEGKEIYSLQVLHHLSERRESNE